ncbi:MAG: hypothetical protein AAFX78_04965 [Cyanobacteria bacterium J06638_20]
MVSPLAQFKNSTLEFQVYAGSPLVQDANGNERPPAAKVTVEAVLEQRNYKLPEKPAGVPIEAVFMTGEIISPLDTPTQKSPFRELVQPGASCKAEISDMTGQFWLQPFVKDPYLDAVDVHIVDEISGWFRIGSDVTIEGDEYAPS